MFSNRRFHLIKSKSGIQHYGYANIASYSSKRQLTFQRNSNRVSCHRCYASKSNRRNHSKGIFTLEERLAILSKCL